MTTTPVRATSGAAVFPVAIIAAIQAALAMAVAFGWLGFIGLNSQDDVAIVAVALNAIGAVYLAYRTHATLLSPVIELFKALVAVGMIYGLHLTDEQSGLAVVFITALFSAFNHASVIPLKKGTFSLVA